MNNIEIDDFPSEVWARVLLNLSTNDFLAVMQASKRLHAICASNYIQKSVFAVIREKSTKHVLWFVRSDLDLVDSPQEIVSHVKEDTSEQSVDQLMDNLAKQDESHLLEKLHESIAKTVQTVQYLRNPEHSDDDIFNYISAMEQLPADLANLPRDRLRDFVTTSTENVLSNACTSALMLYGKRRARLGVASRPREERGEVVERLLKSFVLLVDPMHDISSPLMRCHILSSKIIAANAFNMPELLQLDNNDLEGLKADLINVQSVPIYFTVKTYEENEALKKSTQKNQLLMRAKKSFGEKQHNKNVDREIERELNEVAPRYKTVADIEAQQEILKSLDVIDDEADSSKMLLKLIMDQGFDVPPVLHNDLVVVVDALNKWFEACKLEHRAWSKLQISKTLAEHVAVLRTSILAIDDPLVSGVIQTWSDILKSSTVDVGSGGSLREQWASKLDNIRRDALRESAIARRKWRRELGELRGEKKQSKSASRRANDAFVTKVLAGTTLVVSATAALVGWIMMKRQQNSQ